MTHNPDKPLNSTALPGLVLAGTGAQLLGVDGAIAAIGADEALQLLAREAHLVCHFGFLEARLSMLCNNSTAIAAAQRHWDIAELFAFVCPAQMAVPTPQGLARALGLPVPREPVLLLPQLMQVLLERMADRHGAHPREAMEQAGFLERSNWPWAASVLKALKTADPKTEPPAFATGLNVWDRLPEWEDHGTRPPGGHDPVQSDAAVKLLDKLLGPDAERREEQRQYCAETTQAFVPRQSRYENHIVLAEAGTGLGKTLGYLPAAALWSKQNQEPVWISTYTKNLQRQLDQETRRLFPDPQDQRRHIVVRKGRENYLCLLNLQESIARMTAGNPRSALLAALIVRWARYSRDGDMVGGDFPSWIIGLLNPNTAAASPPSPMSLNLTDRRGECIYAACPHYRKCFIERNVRAARRADLVIANHALVLRHVATEQALEGAQLIAETGEEDDRPRTELTRLVFDEGHHLFDAADSAFSGHLSGREASELRRWIRGPETRSRRGRGLSDRLGELIDDDKDGEHLLQEILRQAACLPGPGWQQRVQSGMPDGAGERFLELVRQQVLARARSSAAASIETDCRPFIDGLETVAAQLDAGLAKLQQPMRELAQRLAKKLDSQAGELETADRIRIEALSRSLLRRSEMTLQSWQGMLARLLLESDAQFVEWFGIDQAFGQEIDVGFHSHWLDPSVPLAATALTQPDGIVITSATLKDRPPETPEDWFSAEMRTGAIHLPYPVKRVSHDSPFDYAANARLIVITDIGRDDMDQLAAAYRELFKASKGGALGLFTAISRLRAVHKRLLTPLMQAGLPLYAQHADPMDTGTLVDLFRNETDACLLGTDAVRDGVDVPGQSLRLIVMDRVPWSQPTILERQRRQAFGGNAYQDMIVRLKLRQAFGRLIRTKHDRGVFVILDSRLASRFCSAFPDGVAPERMGLVDAIEAVTGFLSL